MESQKAYSVTGRNTDNSQTLRVPHGSRPHGHDRILELCVNDSACWKSTPVLQPPPWPDEDLSLLGSEVVCVTYSDSPCESNAEWEPQVNKYYYLRPMDDTREDPSRSLVFFPVKPRSHYMVSGRVESSVTPGGSGFSRPTQSVFGEVGVVTVPLKATSSDLNCINHVSKKEHHQEEGILKM